MADERVRNTSAVLPLRVESGRLLKPDEVADRIENMYLTEDGTLRAVWGPTPYVPAYLVGPPPTPIAIPTYGTMHGIFHCRLNEGARDILIVHYDNEIRAHTGWLAETGVTWSEYIVGPPGSGALIEQDLPNDSRPRFPTQFEVTPTGIVIVPQGGRAIFYDGYKALPLGYDRTPGPPTGLGPGNNSQNAYNFNAAVILTGQVPEPDFHPGRVGTGDYAVVSDTAAGAPTVTVQRAILEEGSWRGAIQWVDDFSNLSPLSGRSNQVLVEFATDTRSPDQLTKYIAWTNIEPGPPGTVGRIVYRTRDEKHSGTLRLFEMPANSASGQLAFATIPDNVADFYPDNTPDSWLVHEPVEPAPVPKFKLCRLAFGVLWIANTPEEPGLLRWSMTSRWGTFLKGDYMFPDPAGGEITGLWKAQQGLLVFTASSIYIILQNEAGDGFRRATLSEHVGCVAPDSIKTLPSGLTVWLGEKGFYAYDGQSVSYIGSPVEYTYRRANRSRIAQACASTDIRTGEYRCWIPTDAGIDNDLCMIYDGAGWRRRTDVTAQAVCNTRDHRYYMIVAGKSTDSTSTTREGVWVLDHEAISYEPEAREATIETTWLKGARSRTRTSAARVTIWLREMRADTDISASGSRLTIDIMRDWREKIEYTDNVRLYPADDIPPFWSDTVLGSNDSEGNPVTWKRRRPHWVKADLYVPACEAFKLRLHAEGDWEFVGLMFEEFVGTTGGGSRIPR